MRKRKDLNLKGPATLEAVLQAVVQLSAYDEAEVQELASTGKLRDLFPFRPTGISEPVADFAAEEELIEASAKPLGRRARKHLIESSMRSSKATSATSYDLGTDYLALAEELKTTSAG